VRPSVDALKADSFDVWSRALSIIPAASHHYITDEQLQKETEVDRLMRAVDADLEATARQAKHLGRKPRHGVRERIQRAIVQLLHTFDCAIDAEMERRFSAVTDDFIRHACDFDPGISDEAVYQASRNLLIMNTIQMFLGREVRLTPSVFAYSMLYPYTDNYLDAADVNVLSKREMNDYLLLRLNGISVPVRNSHEQIIDRLVCMIEQEFDRNGTPQVFESLLAIHRGQIRSVDQCGRADLTPDELLNISVEKGGTSVLADGYLVAGDLAEADAVFLFRFGVLLQLIDDLQDLEEDFSNRQRTLAGVFAGQMSLHCFTNQLLSYLDAVVVQDPHDRARERRNFRALVERGCRLLIFEAIASNERRYDNEYLAMMEVRSPVRFAYLRAVQKRLRNGYSSDRLKGYANIGKPGGSARMRILELVR
jgi:hypothetical protein